MEHGAKKGCFYGALGLSRSGVLWSIGAKQSGYPMGHWGILFKFAPIRQECRFGLAKIARSGPIEDADSPI